MGFDIDLLGSPEEDDALAHYGVKGMRWGVRKQDSLVGRQHTTEEYQKVSYKSSSAPHVELQKNFETFISKSDPSEASGGTPRQGLTPEQKKNLAYAAVGTLAVASAIGYGAYRVKASSVSNPSLPIDFFPENVFLDRQRLENAYFSGRAPAHPGAAQYYSSLQKSTADTWSGTGFIQKSSWDRKEFELPVGHKFNRISQSIEFSFSDTTYATHSEADFNRYVLAFQQSSGKQGVFSHVTWTAEKPVRVPDLTTTLNSLQRAMSSSGQKSVSAESVIKQYESITRDNNWGSPLAKKMFDDLKAKGYSAIVDEMDHGVVSESPVILFDHSGMGPKSSLPMNWSMMDNRISQIQDFPKPPRK